MKGKKFYAILFTLIIVGIGSVQLYRQQQEAKALEFQGYEISKIEERVDTLYNEEKTDIAQEIESEELTDLGEVFDGLKRQKYSGRNKQRINQMELDYLMANDMIDLQNKVRQLFENQDVLKDHVKLRDLEQAEEEVTAYEIMPVYFERNSTLLKDGKEQLDTIEAVRSLLESFFDADEALLFDANREDEEEVLALIREIKNDKIRKELLAQAEAIDVALTVAEEEEALQRELEEQQALLEAEALAETEEALEESIEETWTPPVETWQPSQNSGGQGTGNTRPTQPTQPTQPIQPVQPIQPEPEPESESESEPKPKPNPEPEPEPEPDPETEIELESEPEEPVSGDGDN